MIEILRTDVFETGSKYLLYKPEAPLIGEDYKIDIIDFIYSS